jgi:hypothetical protein
MVSGHVNRSVDSSPPSKQLNSTIWKAWEKAEPHNCFILNGQPLHQVK